MSNIFDSLVDYQKSLNRIMPLAAIWLSRAIKTDKGATVRIEKGDKVRVNDGMLCDISEDYPCSHEVIGCYGNISNTILYFELKDLTTNELLTLNVNVNVEIISATKGLITAKIDGVKYNFYREDVVNDLIKTAVDSSFKIMKDKKVQFDKSE